MVSSLKTTIEICSGLDPATANPITSHVEIETDPPDWANDETDERYLSQWMNTMHKFSIARELAVSGTNRKGGSLPSGDYDVTFIDEQIADDMGHIEDPFIEMEVYERYTGWL